MKRIVIAAACTLGLVGSASAQTYIVEDDYAAPVYEVAPVAPVGPDYGAPVRIIPAPAYAGPVPAPRYIAPRRHFTREVVVTEPEITGPNVVYSDW